MLPTQLHVDPPSMEELREAMWLKHEAINFLRNRAGLTRLEGEQDEMKVATTLGWLIDALAEFAATHRNL